MIPPGTRQFQCRGRVLSVKLNVYLNFPISPCPAGGSLSAQLKQAYLSLVDHQTCSSSSWWGSTVKTTMVCGGGGAAEAGCNVSLLLREKRHLETLHALKLYYCEVLL